MSTGTLTPETGRSHPPPHGRKHRIGYVLLALGVLLALAMLSVLVGSRGVAPGDVLTILRDVFTQLGSAQSNTERAEALGLSVQDYSAVADQRLVRTAICVLAGSALGLAGGLIQSLTRNPLAESGILGLNAGAAFAVALAVVLFGMSAPEQFVWFAMLGALVGTVGVWMIGTVGGGVAPERLTLAGVAFGAVLTGITSAIRLSDPQRFSSLIAWESANLASRTWDVVTPALPLLAVGIVLALVLTPGMNVLALGDDLAVAMGARIGLTRTLMILAITLLTAAATVMAGPISFVGLMAPPTWPDGSSDPTRRS